MKVISLAVVGALLGNVKAQSCPPVASNAFFRVTAANRIGCSGPPNPTGSGTSNRFQATCYTTTGGTCFTDGPGNHGNNERCTINVLRDGFLTVPSGATYSLEYGWDYIFAGGQRHYTQASIQGQCVKAGDTINWYSDGSVTRPGFTVCGTLTNPSPTTTLSCSFATPCTSLSLIGWTTKNGGGQTPTASTGPSTGQAGNADNYIYFEADGQSATATATLSGLRVGCLGSVVSFYYHMYGADMGTLAAEYCQGSNCVTFFEKIGQQQSNATASWTLFQTLIPEGTTAIRFIAARGPGSAGDMALDTISISPPQANNNLRQAAFLCDFDATSGLGCGMTSTVIGTTNPLWTVDRNGGSTPSSATGPSSGQSGPNDNFAHIEASGQSAASSSALWTPPLAIGLGGAQLAFFYHMYGQHIGTLSVLACPHVNGTSCTVLWSRTGQQQNGHTAAWIGASVAIPPGTSIVKFNGTRLAGGGSWRGDISIDTIRIVPNFQGPPCAAASPSAFFTVSRTSPITGCTGTNPTTPAQGSCYTTQNGTCVTNIGAGNTYLPNERCTIRVHQDGFMYVPGTMAALSSGDGFMVSGETAMRSTMAQLNNIQVQSGQNISWMSGNQGSGFTICAATSRAPTAAPTEEPSAAPSAAPTEAPTAAPTAAPVDASSSSSVGATIGGSSIVFIVVIVAAAVVVAAIAFIVLKSGSSGKSDSSTGAAAATGFENPVYAEEEGIDGDGYMDVDATGDDDF